MVIYNTDSNDSVLIRSIVQCLAELSLILRGINDEGIGWCNHDMDSLPNTFRCNRPGLEKSYC